MSKPPDNTTQTTSTEPPDYLLPFLRQSAGSASALFNSGPSVVPFSQQTNQALNLQQNRALGGSPLVSSAQGLTNSTLNGDFLNSNPYLDATFDRAAGAVNRSLDETYARSGRDLDSNMAVRADQLNNLATNIYGGNYQNERDRQMGALGAAVPLAREDYFDISQLGNVGAAVEGQAQNILDAPFMALERFNAGLSGAPMGQTSSTTTPLYSNPAGGLLGGALTGAQLAPMLGMGGGMGAGLGGLLGLMSDRRVKEDIRRVGTTDEGIPIYVYRYKGNPVWHMGVMAQEVEHIPGAVFEVNGIKHVKYEYIH